MIDEFVIYVFDAETGVGEYIDMTPEQIEQLKQDQKRWENIDGV
jgi:hypothetical protein